MSKAVKLTEADIGRKVIYRPGVFTEEGVITSFNDKYVFVRYGGDAHSKATYPRDLTWLDGRAILKESDNG